MKKFLLFLLFTLFAVGCLSGCGEKASSSNPLPPDGNASSSHALPSDDSANNEDPAPSDEVIQNSIVGAWVGEDEDGNKLPYIFYEDGTGIAAIFPLTYTLDGDNITIVIQGFDSEEVLSAKYTVTGDTLTLDTGEATAVLQRTELPEQ